MAMLRRKARAVVQVVAWDELGRSREVQFGAAVGGAPNKAMVSQPVLPPGFIPSLAPPALLLSCTAVALYYSL